FCHRHDAELFRPVETTNFSFEPEQIALLGYRVICHDSYQKYAAIAAMDAARSYVMLQPDIGGFAEKDAIYQIQRLGMLNARKNFTRARSVFADMIAKCDFSDLRFFGLQLDAPPMYLASSMLLP